MKMHKMFAAYTNNSTLGKTYVKTMTTLQSNLETNHTLKKLFILLRLSGPVCAL